jgi:hypothetical protein
MFWGINARRVRLVGLILKNEELVSNLVKIACDVSVYP